MSISLPQGARRLANKALTIQYPGVYLVTLLEVYTYKVVKIVLTVHFEDFFLSQQRIIRYRSGLNILEAY